MRQAARFNGNRLLQLRKAHGWSLEDLSRRSSVSVSHISQLEKGTRKSPSIDLVYQLAEALSVSIYQLLERVTYDAPASGAADAETHETGDPIKEWGKTLSPDVLQFVLSDQSEQYLLFAKRLQENRNSSKEVLLLVSEFMQRLGDDGASERPKP